MERDGAYRGICSSQVLNDFSCKTKQERQQITLPLLCYGRTVFYARKEVTEELGVSVPYAYN